MLHPNPLMLLRQGQADAYAAAAEYAERELGPDEYRGHIAALRALKAYLPHPKFGLCACYTDDTQMAVAVAEVLIAGKQHDADAFLNQFYAAFVRDPRKGYSGALQHLLESSSSADELRQRLVPTSDRNGAAMRAAPIGVLTDPKEVVEVARLQATVTHNTPGGLSSSVAVALMSHFAMHTDEPFSSMHKVLKAHESLFRMFAYRPWSGPVEPRRDANEAWLSVGVQTAWAVYTLLVEQKSLAGILDQALAWGGDTDSVASIAWAIAAARYPDEQVPAFFERDLEALSLYGPMFLRTIGERLTRRYLATRVEPRLRARVDAMGPDDALSALVTLRAPFFDAPLAPADFDELANAVLVDAMLKGESVPTRSKRFANVQSVLVEGKKAFLEALMADGRVEHISLNAPPDPKTQMEIPHEPTLRAGAIGQSRRPHGAARAHSSP